MRFSRGLLLALVTTACDGSQGSPAAPPDAGPPDASPPDALPATVHVLGTVYDYWTLEYLADMTVAVVDHPEIPVTTTDMAGVFDLAGVPSESDVTLRFEGNEYLPTATRVLHTSYLPYELSSGQVFGLVLRSHASVLASIIGVEVDPTRGFVALIVDDEDGVPIAGATAAISPDDCGAPPLYFNDSDFPDPSLTATTSNSTVAFVNCMPGAHEITVTHPGYSTCVTAGPDAQVPLRVRVFADTVTNAHNLLCSP